MNTNMTSRYVNVEAFRTAIEGVIDDTTKSWDYAVEYVQSMKDAAEDYRDEYVDGIVEDTIVSFDKYVHKSDTSLWGNFADIQMDYDREHPGKAFRKVIAMIDAGEENADTVEFRDWAVDWYFTAFGTYNLSYKWTEFMEEITYDYEDDADEDAA